MNIPWLYTLQIQSLMIISIDNESTVYKYI